MTIAVFGAGAFGTALAVALARDGREVCLWARDPAHAAAMSVARMNDRRLPGLAFPDLLTVTADSAALAGAGAALVAVPMQSLAGFLDHHGQALAGRPVVACMKGFDLNSLRGPVSILRAKVAGYEPALLTGPSFAADIGRGLPTALTLACADEALGARLQEMLATPVLRLYRTDDTVGAELGGALKNVVAIAAGVVIGAELGDSARAALMTRGFAEMGRLAPALGARAETLAGLSGLGDLVLTCTSDQSRNFRFGRALGRGESFDGAITVEGAATAKAVTAMAAARGIDMPISAMVAALVDRKIAVGDAVAALMARPLKKE